MKKILTIGEVMMRLQPPNFKRFKQTNSFDVCFGGGEANVAVSLAQFGENAVFLSKLPANDIGDMCAMELKKWDVDTSHIARGGERLGIYFCEKGASQRASKVIYDRAHASINTLADGDIDIQKAVLGASWLHFTGITPALCDEVAQYLESVLKVCKANGVTVSCDLNYRNKLWSKDKACLVMSGLMKYVDVLISNEEDCKDVFGIVPANSDIEKGELNINGYLATAKIVREKFGIKTIAFTLRESISASVNNWSGLLIEDDKFYHSKKYTLNIVDRVGGGDSFSAGLIHALSNEYEPSDAINFAVASSAIKHTIEGDFNIATVSEVSKLAGGNGSGRVER